MNRKGIILIVAAAVALVTGNDAMAQRRFYDAAAFDLKGNVKMCAISNRQFPSMKDYYHFDDEGAFITDDAEAERDANGLPTRITTIEHALGQLGILFGASGERTRTFTYTDMRDGDEAAMCVTTKNPDGTKMYIYYDGNGNATHGEREKNTYEYYDLAFLRFEPTEFDSHGNWTRRIVYESTAENGDKEVPYTETREIEYWEDGSPDYSVVNVFFNDMKFVEPSRELSIEDMMHRPFGVIDVPDPWSLVFADVIKEVARRSNWTISPIIYSISVNRSGGYNFTYRGEPLSSADVAPSLRSDKLGEYGFWFSRNIRGVVPKYKKSRTAEILSGPQWTDEEAIAFARNIVADIEATGLKMVKIKGFKRDIFTMGADDGTSFYKVRIFRIRDKYSASLSVILDVYPTDSILNPLRKD